MASGIARGSVLSPTTTTVSHQYDDIRHASLVKIRPHKGSRQLNDIRCSCQLTAVKTRNPLTSVTRSYRGLRCTLRVCLLDDGVGQDGAQRKYTTQFMRTAYIFAILYRWSVLWSIDSCQYKIFADQYHMTVLRAQVKNSLRARIFLKLNADQL